MTTNILLLGADGQVRWELRRSLLSAGKVSSITDQTTLNALLTNHKPDIIVNAAAYTAVDLAESESEQAYALNCDLPAQLGEFARQRNSLVVDYSTDSVFDGSKSEPYFEHDITAPPNIYGASNLAGPQALQASSCRHLVFRVSWVYSTRRGNFVKTILRLAAERDELNIVSDQVGSPTPASLIADVTVNCLLLLAAGTHESLLEAASFIKTIETRQDLKIACLEEIAYRMGYIDTAQVEKLAEPLKKNGYGQYLLQILKKGVFN